MKLERAKEDVKQFWRKESTQDTWSSIKLSAKIGLVIGAFGAGIILTTGAAKAAASAVFGKD